MDEHQLISALKNLAAELGQTPTRDQFSKYIGKGAFKFEFFFGNWNRFVDAAGLAPVRNSQRIDNSIFKKDIEQHLEQYKPEKFPKREPWPKILILGDIHFPFVNQDALNACYEFAAQNNPEYIVQIGDLYDMYSWSKFPKSQNIFSPQEEETLARNMAEKMWASFSGKKIQICGNHDQRPVKRALESLPSVEHIVEKHFKGLMAFDGVETIFDSREEYKISDITFIHGHLSGIGKHRDHFLGNTVVGHSHTGGVSYRQINGKVIWELNAGYLGDQFSKGLSYTPTKTVPWTLGWGFIDKYGARFCSF